MVLGENLRQLRQENGLTQAQLGTFLNLAESTISLYEAGKRSPDYATLKKIADFFAVTVDYLLRNPISANISLEANSTYESDSNQLIQLPIVTDVRRKGEILSYQQEHKQESYLAQQNDYQNLYWYRVNNDSLIGDGILPGDLALVFEPAPFLQNQIGLVYLPSDECRLCRISQQDNCIILQFSNPVHPPIIYGGKEVNKLKILGKAIEIRRKY